jgi:hypothetical protein
MNCIVALSFRGRVSCVGPHACLAGSHPKDAFCGRSGFGPVSGCSSESLSSAQIVGAKLTAVQARGVSQRVRWVLWRTTEHFRPPHPH